VTEMKRLEPCLADMIEPTVMKISFKDLDLRNSDAAKLRGAVAAKFPGYFLLHHHIAKGRLLYQYPRIQFKIINGTPVILGIENGINVLKKIYGDIGELRLSSFAKNFQSEIEIQVNAQPFGASDGSKKYRFVNLWLALNQNNYEKYHRLGQREKRISLLERILIGNIISMSKGLGYTVPGPIKANIREVREVQTSLKGKPMLGFLGSFSVNFEIPDYLGIGKSVSRGFGTVKRTRCLFR